MALFTRLREVVEDFAADIWGPHGEEEGGGARAGSNKDIGKMTLVTIKIHHTILMSSVDIVISMHVLLVIIVWGAGADWSGYEPEWEFNIELYIYYIDISSQTTALACGGTVEPS